VLDALRELGLIEGMAPRWRPTQALVEQLRPMAAAFGAIDVYQSRVQRDATLVGIVTTKPDRAIALDRELASAGWQAARTEDTDESILSLFTGAMRRIVVMTPFLDRPGAVILRSLLQRVHAGVEISLVLRNLDRPDRDDYPLGYPLISDWLSDCGVRVSNYSLRHIPHGPVETFHTKLVLADDARAYVGSANMTGSSFENSVELGVLLSGAAARQLEHFVRAVLRCAQPWQGDALAPSRIPRSEG
jgi:phosphatidylserine/phosphatidylglycerophosphate/cardiolipin synthase-like enzyme